MSVSLTAQPVLEAASISKRFGGVRALNQVSLAIPSGRVLGLVGENGAGKSTLLNVISGVVAPDEGSVMMAGQPLPVGRAHQALSRGVATVHQELTLFGNLTVADNVGIGHEPTGRTRRVDRRRLAERARDLLSQVGSSLDPRTLVGDLSLADQQIVEIAKALSWDPRVLILDEATSALGEHAVEALFGCVRRLAADGCGVVFVSHRMEEIFEIADTAVVLKDGAAVATFEDLGSIDEHALIAAMVGRALQDVFPSKSSNARTGPPMIHVRGLSGGAARDVSLAVHSGEIVGLGGLQGHGQQDVLRPLFGARSSDSGDITVGGTPYRPSTPRSALAVGIGYVPPDRKTEGLLLRHPVETDLTLAALGDVLRGAAGTVATRRERDLVADLRDRLQIRQRQWRQPTESLSGGNQQKVVLGKWLARNCRVLLLDEPTRGVDVGTKAEVYRLIRALADEGRAVLIASTDSLELLGLCDRLYVLYEGRVHRELEGAELTEHALTAATMGMGELEDVR